jgi:hypothetical protein
MLDFRLYKLLIWICVCKRERERERVRDRVRKRDRQTKREREGRTHFSYNHNIVRLKMFLKNEEKLWKRVLLLFIPSWQLYLGGTKPLLPLAIITHCSSRLDLLWILFTLRRKDYFFSPYPIFITTFYETEYSKTAIQIYIFRKD